MHPLGIRVLVTDKDAEVFFCKSPNFVFVSLIFHMKNLMYQGSHGSAFNIKMYLLFFVILQLFLKESSSFGKNANHAFTAASSSNGPAILFLKRKNPDLNIRDILFLDLFPLNYPLEEILEQRFFQGLRNCCRVICVKT